MSRDKIEKAISLISDISKSLNGTGYKDMLFADNNMPSMNLTNGQYMGASPNLHAFAIDRAVTKEHLAAVGSNIESGEVPPATMSRIFQYRAGEIRQLFKEYGITVKHLPPISTSNIDYIGIDLRQQDLILKLTNMQRAIQRNPQSFSPEIDRSAAAGRA